MGVGIRLALGFSYPHMVFDTEVEVNRRLEDMLAVGCKRETAALKPVIRIERPMLVNPSDKLMFSRLSQP